MSRGAGFSDQVLLGFYFSKDHACRFKKLKCLYYLMQVVELDFLYPSEGVHRRWDGGYRITSTAATADQTALVLSIPRRKPPDETQETLRTSAFPSTHVKVSKQFTFSRC